MGLLVSMPFAVATTDASEETKRSELRQIERRIKLYETNNKELEELRKTITEELRNFSSELVTKARRISLYEQQMQSARTQMQELEKEEKIIRNKLSLHNGYLIEILIAMQRIGGNPPPGIVVNAEKLYDAIRASKLLNTVLNTVNQEVATLKNEVKQMLALQERIEKKKQNLSHNYTLLTKEKNDINAIIKQRNLTQKNISEKILQQKKQVKNWYAEAKDLKELFALLEGKKQSKKITAPSLDKGKELQLSLDTSFINNKGSLLFPVNGDVIRGFGQKDLDGNASKGLFVETTDYAQVISPVDGWVEYADDFGNYGKLVILKVGKKYRLLLTGMQHIYIQPGFFVLRGEPIGVMGNYATASLNLTRNDADLTSVLYIELRKDGKALDSKSWWEKKI